MKKVCMLLSTATLIMIGSGCSQDENNGVQKAISSTSSTAISQDGVEEGYIRYQSESGAFVHYPNSMSAQEVALQLAAFENSEENPNGEETNERRIPAGTVTHHKTGAYSGTGTHYATEEGQRHLAVWLPLRSIKAGNNANAVWYHKRSNGRYYYRHHILNLGRMTQYGSETAPRYAINRPAMYSQNLERGEALKVVIRKTTTTMRQSDYSLLAN